MGSTTQEDEKRVRTLLTETVTLLCRNGLEFKQNLKVQGLLGITIDEDRVFIVQLDNRIDSACSDPEPSSSRKRTLSVESSGSDPLARGSPSKKTRSSSSTSRKVSRSGDNNEHETINLDDDSDKFFGQHGDVCIIDPPAGSVTTKRGARSGAPAGPGAQARPVETIHIPDDVQSAAVSYKITLNETGSDNTDQQTGSLHMTSNVDFTHPGPHEPAHTSTDSTSQTQLPVFSPPAASNPCSSQSHVPNSSAESHLLPPMANWAPGSGMPINYMQQRMPPPGDMTRVRPRYPHGVPVERKPRTVLSLEDKVRLIREAESPEKTQVDLQRQFNVSATQVWYILKQKERLLSMFESSKANPTANDPYRQYTESRFSHLSTEGQEMEKKLVDWHTEASKRGDMTSYMLQDKALEIATELGLQTFMASATWLASFKRRNNIT